MIKFRKFFALILCILISVQGISVIAEDSSQNAQDNLVYSQIAVKLGILDTSVMGRLNSYITRGELVAAVMNLRGVEGSAEGIFSDVDATHPYADEITIAYQMGYISGFGDGTFRPDEPATYSQALKLLVYLAGYDKLVENGLTIEAAANQAKIIKHIKLSSSPNIKVGEAAQFLVNVGAGVDVLDISSITNTNSQFAKNGRSIMNEYLNVYEKTAILSSNSKTGIYENSGLGENIVMIDDEKMVDETDNAEDLLGCNVTAYVYNSKNGLPRLLYVYANDRNKIIDIPSVRFDQFKNGKLYYEDEDGEYEDVSIKLSSVATIYNGILTITPSASDFEIETGSIRLIDNNKDGEIDVVSILKYDNLIVDSYDSINNVIWFKFGDGMLDIDGLNEVNITSADGKILNLGELVEYDVLSISRSKGNEFVNVVYIPGEIEGEVGAIYSKDEKKIEIDGKEYNLAKSFIDNFYDDVYIGQYGNFYLDIEGKIASINNSVSNEKNFYYLIEISGGKGFELNPRIKLMDEMGEVKILPLASAVDLDGEVKVTKNAADMQVLENLGPQIFIGILNSSGKLKYIDTVNGNDGGLTLLRSNTEMQYKKNTMLFHIGGKEQLPISSSTVYMYVPLPGKIANDDDYYINSISGMQNNSKFAFSAYTDGEGIVADAIVRTHNPESGVSFPQDLAPAVVNNITKAINTNGEASYKISIFNSSGSMAQYYTESESILSGLKLNGKSYFPKKGDIVRISTNRYGEIRGLDPVYCTETGEIAGETNPSVLDNLAVYRIQLAYAYKKDGNFVLTTTTKPTPEHLNTDEGLENLEYKNLGVYKMCVYDSKNDTLTTADSLSVRDFISTGGLEASKLFVFERYLETGMVCVYK